MKLEIEKKAAMSIILLINDGVCEFICKVYSSVLKEYTQHEFSMKVISQL